MDDDDGNLTADEYYDCLERFLELGKRQERHGLGSNENLEKDNLEIIIEEYEEENKNEK